VEPRDHDRRRTQPGATRCGSATISSRFRSARC
jgi:hypothetical protein